MHRSSRIVLMLVLAPERPARRGGHAALRRGERQCHLRRRRRRQLPDHRRPLGLHLRQWCRGAILRRRTAAQRRQSSGRDQSRHARRPRRRGRPATARRALRGVCRSLRARGIDGLPATRTPPGGDRHVPPCSGSAGARSGFARRRAGCRGPAPGARRGERPDWALARLLPFVPPSISASDIQASLKATDHTARHQALVARTRGDAGYLGGFSMGVPLSASVQKPVGGPVWYGSGHRRHDVRLADDPATGTPDSAGLQQPLGQDPGRSGRRGRPTVIVNNTFDGPVAITRGNGNVVQQQSASGAGPIALQQVSSSQGRAGRAAR